MFVEIYEFVINSQDVKYIHFDFIPEKDTNLTGNEKAKMVYASSMHHLDQLANPSELQSIVTFGETTITIVFNKYESIIIKRTTSSIEFEQRKLNILAQLNNDVQSVSKKSDFWRHY